MKRVFGARIYELCGCGIVSGRMYPGPLDRWTVSVKICVYTPRLSPQGNDSRFEYGSDIDHRAGRWASETAE